MDCTARNMQAIAFMRGYSAEAAAQWIRLSHATQDADDAAKRLASLTGLTIDEVRIMAETVVQAR